MRELRESCQLLQLRQLNVDPVHFSRGRHIAILILLAKISSSGGLD